MSAALFLNLHEGRHRGHALHSGRGRAGCPLNAAKPLHRHHNKARPLPCKGRQEQRTEPADPGTLSLAPAGCTWPPQLGCSTRLPNHVPPPNILLGEAPRGPRPAYPECIRLFQLVSPATWQQHTTTFTCVRYSPT